MPAEKKQILSPPEEEPLAYTTDNVLTFMNITEALQFASQGNDPSLPLTFHTHSPVPDKLKHAKHIQVLCCGSLHLIGGIIGVLEPNFNDKVQS